MTIIGDNYGEYDTETGEYTSVDEMVKEHFCFECGHKIKNEIAIIRREGLEFCSVKCNEKHKAAKFANE